MRIFVLKNTALGDECDQYCSELQRYVCKMVGETCVESEVPCPFTLHGDLLTYTNSSRGVDTLFIHQLQGSGGLNIREIFLKACPPGKIILCCDNYSPLDTTIRLAATAHIIISPTTGDDLKVYERE